MTNYLTLCAGQSVRFHGSPKHLLTIGGETLLDRQKRQFPGTMMVDHSVVGVTKFTCETLIKTKDRWTERTVILLGDVYFTDTTAAAIMANKDRLAFWTDMQDIFAIAFDQEVGSEIEKAAQAVLVQDPVPNEGRLWEMYRQLVGLTNTAHLPPDDLKYLILVQNQTQDFDTLDEYKAFLGGESKNTLLRRLREFSPQIQTNTNHE